MIDDSIQVLPDSSKRVLNVHMHVYVDKHRLSVEPTKSKWIVRSYPDNNPIVWCISEDVLTAIGTVVDYIHENIKEFKE